MEYHAEEKHEFIDGHVILYNSGDTGIYMAGASPNHQEITALFQFLVNQYLRQAKGGLLAYGSDAMVGVGETNRYFYPDLTIPHGPKEYLSSGKRRVLANPMVVVEVLSESTMKYDLTKKLEAYKSHPTLKQIVYIDSQEVMAMSYMRTERAWELDGPYYNPADLLKIDSIGFSAPLQSIYSGLMESGDVKVG